ncbi:hypothetical protein K2X33_15620 [bacterium]|nr:hypothetical protein [bacterium]
MKAILSAFLLAAPAFATSPMHPYTFSVSEIQDVLQNADVQKKLWNLNEPIESVTKRPLRHGGQGWVITAGKCDLEVQVRYHQVPSRDPRTLGMTSRRSIQVGNCR